MAEVSLVKLPSGDCHWTSLMTSQHWQVMACCRQATSHYLNQCWPRSVSPYGVTRPQWVKKKTMITSHWLIVAWTKYKPALVEDNGLVLSGTKLLPEPMTADIYNIIYNTTRPQWVHTQTGLHPPISFQLPSFCSLRQKLIESFITCMTSISDITRGFVMI